MKFSIANPDNDIFIHLLLNSSCNFKCPYCCATQISSHSDVLKINNQYSELNRLDIDDILKYLTVDNIRLLILGGEPTLSKNLQYLLNKAYLKQNITSIEILTNGSVPLSKFKFNKKVQITFTYHPYIEHQKNIIKNVEYCLKNNIAVEFNVMIPQDKHYKNIDKLERILKILKVEMIPIYPYLPNYKFNHKPYDFENLKFFKYNNRIISLREVYENNLNKFKNWKCYNKSFIIDINKKVRQCSGEVLGDIETFDFNNFIQVCKLDYCIYEGFLRNTKEN